MVKHKLSGYVLPGFKLIISFQLSIPDPLNFFLLCLKWFTITVCGAASAWLTLRVAGVTRAA